MITDLTRMLVAFCGPNVKTYRPSAQHRINYMLAQGKFRNNTVLAQCHSMQNQCIQIEDCGRNFYHRTHAAVAVNVMHELGCAIR